ncbi:RNA polymerase sigma factor [Listeria costaricensis]|uniref:RNA polymerase sigma factor n=1 Tax=Listeria costaricensis TaxID=2026604 RepID=UPI000C083273|nr:sigma-70 family RNA polymerase sigma factor [Listeria costaricensis]
MQLIDEPSLLNTYFPVNIGGLEVIVLDENIAKSIEQLSEDYRKIILLSYFFDMNDREIAEQLNMVQRTVNRWRKKALQELKNVMEDNTNK